MSCSMLLTLMAGFGSLLESSAAADEPERWVRFTFADGASEGWQVVQGYCDEALGVNRFVRPVEPKSPVRKGQADHYYTNVGRDCVTCEPMYPEGSRLCLLDVRSDAAIVGRA